MRLGSLFAGVGGFDLAAERTGLEVAFQSENDPHASMVLAERFPSVPNLGDIHGVETYPDVDVLSGGFPCQDYSVAGLRSGLDGDRGALWWEFHRLISAGRPRWVIGENVPGLLSSRGGRDFATIVDSLTDLGYRVAWRVLDAQYFGVAQRRRRLFLVGSLGGRSVSEVLALADGVSGHPAPRRTERPSSPGGTPRGTRSGLLADGGVVRALTERLGKTGVDLTDAEAGHIVGPLTAGMGRGPRGTEAIDSGHLAYSRVVSFIQRQDRSVNVHDDYVGPLSAGNRGTTQRPMLLEPRVRRLTPVECERLQGFPDDWTGSMPDTRRYSQMGNAVAVPVAEWILRRLVEEEERWTKTARSESEDSGS